MKRKEPQHMKIRNDMKAEIARNKEKQFQLPTEAELCVSYGVSRMTVNKAIGMLVQEGLVTRIPGKGTFAIPNAIRKGIEESRSFSRDIQTIGSEPGSILLDFRVESVSDYTDLNKTFKCPEDEKVIFFERLRTSNGKPLAISRTYVLAKVVPEINKEALENSFYEFLYEKYGIIPQCSDYMIKARKPTKNEAKILKADSEPLLEVRHLSYTQSNVLFEYCETAYLGNHFFYVSGEALHPRLQKGSHFTIRSTDSFPQPNLSSED